MKPFQWDVIRKRQAMPGGTLTGAFVHSSFNIYTKAVVTFTCIAATVPTITITYKTDMYCSSNHNIYDAT